MPLTKLIAKDDSEKQATAKETENNNMLSYIFLGLLAISLAIALIRKVSRR